MFSIEINPPPAGSRQSPSRGVLPAVGVTAVLLALVSGCSRPPQAALPPPIVEVVEVKATGVPMSVEIIGQLDSPQNVEVRARVEGFVEKVFFTEGTEVKQGDPLFELDTKPYEQRLLAAQASLAEARASLNKAEKDVARLEPLAAKRAIPQQDLDNALAALDVARASVLSAEARVRSAEIDLGYCDVRSPITGLIGAKEVSIGDLVGKGEPTLLATVSTLDPIWFYCNISEIQYLEARAKSGRQMGEEAIALILGDGTTHPAKGRFVFIDRAVDPTTGTFRARAEFRNPDWVLRPGMFARIKVDLGLRPDSILVPERALVELQGRSFVWVIDGGNTASQRPVEVASWRLGSDALVMKGLRPGERIVVEGVQKVREGGPVQVASSVPVPVAAPSAKE